VKRPGPPAGSDTYRIDDDWKVAVKAALDERGMTQRELGSKVGLTEGGVSRLLVPARRDGPRRSAYAHKISAMLGVPLPRQASNPRTAAVIDAIEEILEGSPAAFDRLETETLAVRAELRRLLRRTPPKRPKPDDI
jgi:transcriptional regulator with XRE-family HTH domain